MGHWVNAGIAAASGASALRESLIRAEQHRLSGRLIEAEAQCRQILSMRPNEPDALHLLALVEYQGGRLAEAIGHVKRAAALAPDRATFHVHLAEMCRRAGRLREAITAGRRAAKLKPDHPETLAHLGAAHFEARNYEEAAACYRRVAALRPDWAEAHRNLAKTLDVLGRAEEATASRQQAAALETSEADAAAPPAAPRKRTLTPDEALALASEHFRAGRLREAEALCRRVLEVAPNKADAAHILGIAAHRAKRLDAAISHLSRAIEIDGEVARYHCDLAEMYRLDGQPGLAEAAACRALALEPAYPAALNNLGVALYDLGRYEQALDCYDRAIALDGELASAHSNRGNALQALGRLDEAEDSYRRALALNPQFTDAWNNLGTTLRALKRLEEAEAAYRKALETNRRDPGTLDNLALALADLGRLEEAVDLLERAIAIAPGSAKLNVHLGGVLIAQREIERAAGAAERALALAPDSHETLNLMGRIAAERGRPKSALACFRHAIELNPGAAEIWNNAGNALRVLGRLDEAREAFSKAIELDPARTGAYFNLADCMTFTADHPQIAAMEDLAGQAGLTADERIHLHFALGKAYADIGDHCRAFEHILEGNRAKRAQIDYDEAAALGLFSRIERVFSRKLIEAQAGKGDASRMPIFVFGMPRSGTTLVEQILASHPEVHGAGEPDILATLVRTARGHGGSAPAYPELVPLLASETLEELGKRYVAQLGRQAPGAARVTDKMPANFLFAGLIHLMLPNAVMIHVVRDPVDTCVSCFFKLFSGALDHTYDLGELGRYYRRYEHLMAHWRQVLPQGRILEVRYEDVVEDLEGQARRILSHCGLAWDARCLAFHQTERPVHTASATQVRQPVYKNAVDRSRPYRGFLKPLLKELKVRR